MRQMTPLGQPLIVLAAAHEEPNVSESPQNRPTRGPDVEAPFDDGTNPIGLTSDPTMVIGEVPVDETEMTSRLCEPSTTRHTRQGPPERDIYQFPNNAGEAEDEPRGEAFMALRQAVHSLHHRGRYATAAATKPELQHLTAGGFHEGILGYHSFREFLDDAAASGIVVLAPFPGGDIEVTLPGEPPPTIDVEKSRKNSAVTSRARIRADFWTAFVDFTPNWVRLFDQTDRRAKLFPEHRQLLEPEELSNLRQAWADDPSRFIKIENISPEQQSRWMRSFAERLGEEDATAREFLLAALKEGRPLARFARSVRSFPELMPRWQSALVELVQEVIDEWIQKNGLTLSIVDDGTPPPLSPLHLQQRRSANVTQRPTRPAITQGAAARREFPRSNVENPTLRAQILDVLNKLSDAELLELRVPIVYTLRDERPR